MTFVGVIAIYNLINYVTVGVIGGICFRFIQITFNEFINYGKEMNYG